MEPFDGGLARRARGRPAAGPPAGQDVAELFGALRRRRAGAPHAGDLGRARRGDAQGRWCAGPRPSGAAWFRRPSGSRCGRVALGALSDRVFAGSPGLVDVEGRASTSTARRAGTSAAASTCSRSTARRSRSCAPRGRPATAAPRSSRPPPTCATSPSASARRTAAIRSSARGRRACWSETSRSTSWRTRSSSPPSHIRDSFLAEGVPAERLRAFPLTPDPRYTPARGAGRRVERFRGPLRGQPVGLEGGAAARRGVRGIDAPDLRLVLLGGWASRGMRRFLTAACGVGPPHRGAPRRSARASAQREPVRAPELGRRFRLRPRRGAGGRCARRS